MTKNVEFTNYLNTIKKRLRDGQELLILFIKLIIIIVFRQINPDK